MTVVNRTRQLQPQPQDAPTRMGASLAVTVRWSLSADALRRAAGPFAMRVQPWLTALDIRSLETSLEWRIDVEAGTPREPDAVGTFDAVATLCGAGAAPLELLHVLAPESHLALVHDGDLAHVHLTSPSGETLLSATLRRAGDQTTVLYAATPLLARLGLPGGRYEVVGGSLRATAVG